MQAGAGGAVGDRGGFGADGVLVEGRLLRRYKRFLADVALASGETVTAHCPNSGSMLSVDTPGAAVWLSRADKPGRKLAYTWELIRIGDTLVGINTGRPNGLAAAAIAAGTIPELAGYDRIRREVRYADNCRIDLLLEADGRPRCFVEVKNVTMRRDLEADGPLEFPDSVTTRGRKHLDALAGVVAGGDRAVLLFLAQRGDGNAFAIASDIDPAYALAFGSATGRGVEALCYRCRVSLGGIRVDTPVPIASGEAAWRHRAACERATESG
jgi:sugar fermentation stimulation protein A